MLTIDIQVNGKTIASAALHNTSNLADLSNYEVSWAESEEPDMGIRSSQGDFTITGHRRRQSVWALAGKAVVAILDQMGGDPRDR